MTLTLPPAARTLPAGSLDASVPRRWPGLVPGESKDFGINVSRQLAPGETFTSVSAAVSSPSGLLNVDQVGWVGAVLVTWLSGGSSGEDVPVTVTAVTSGGRTLVFVIMLLCGAPIFGTPAYAALVGEPPTALNIQSALASLPTTLPSAPGQLWWNNGVLSQS